MSISSSKLKSFICSEHHWPCVLNCAHDYRIVQPIIITNGKIC